MGGILWVIALVMCTLESSMAQTNAQTKPPALFPRRHYSWQRLVNDELIREKAFSVENPDVQAVALISRDPQLGEVQFFGSVSIYDFTTPKPGGQANITGQSLELSGGDLPLTNSERAEAFSKNPVLMRLCYRQPMFKCTALDPLAFDPYLAIESEQLTFSALTLDSSVTITFTWEAMTR